MTDETENLSCREEALLDVMTGETPLCPYLFQVPAEGAHGPQTCMGGCVEEPCTTSGPYPIFKYPDLANRIRREMVANTAEHTTDPEHPAFEWLKAKGGDGG